MYCDRIVDSTCSTSVLWGVKYRWPLVRRDATTESVANRLTVGPPNTTRAIICSSTMSSKLSRPICCLKPDRYLTIAVDTLKSVTHRSRAVALM